MQGRAFAPRKLLVVLSLCLPVALPQRDLLDEAPWLQRSIRVRNPYVDPMNYVQVALLRRRRENAGEAEAEEMRDAVRLSVNGIAAGLRNTG